MRPALLASALLFVYALAGATETSNTAPSATDIVTLVRDLGFPIVVVIWFMWRMEKRLDRYTEQIEKLYTVVTVLVKTVDNDHG